MAEYAQIAMQMAGETNLVYLDTSLQTLLYHPDFGNQIGSPANKATFFTIAPFGETLLGGRRTLFTPANCVSPEAQFPLSPTDRQVTSNEVILRVRSNCESFGSKVISFVRSTLRTTAALEELPLSLSSFVIPEARPALRRADIDRPNLYDVIFEAGGNGQAFLQGDGQPFAVYFLVNNQRAYLTPTPAPGRESPRHRTLHAVAKSSPSPNDFRFTLHDIPNPCLTQEGVLSKL